MFRFTTVILKVPVTRNGKVCRNIKIKRPSKKEIEALVPLFRANPGRSLEEMLPKAAGALSQLSDWREEEIAELSLPDLIRVCKAVVKIIEQRSKLWLAP